MRRALSVLAAPAALVLLAGCGLSLGGEAPSPTSEPSSSTAQPTEVQSSQASTSEASRTAEPGRDDGDAKRTPSTASPSASATEEHPSDAATASASASASPTDHESDAPSANGPTDVVSVWVDSSWNIEESEEDFCSFGGASPSQFSDGGRLFTCGPTAASALACDLEDDGTVLCITNAAEKQALRFPSPSLVAEGEPARDGGSATVPLHVTLDDGNQCYVLSHDQSPHWGGKFSWYGCDDGSKLLTDADLEGTFERGETWTVQRSIDGGEPVETSLKEVVFAGEE